MTKVTVLNKLACQLGRRDEAPNQKLAEEIVDGNDRRAVDELVENLSNKDQSIQSDCIEVLYEIGERKPELIADRTQDFGRLLSSKNNRLVWGAMTALDAVATLNPKGVYDLLPLVIAATKSGSVITRDHGVAIFAKLAKEERYAGICLPLLLEQLKASPDNQFPMYAEMSTSLISETNKKDFIKVFKHRMGRLKKKSQKKRVEKLLRKLA